MSYRLLGEGRSFYHCVSRVVDRRFVFGEEEKAVFRRTMRLLERFTGVRVVTYCVMSNHFHLLLDVPDRKSLKPLTLEELIALIPELHEASVAEGVMQEIERAIEAGRVSEPIRTQSKNRLYSDSLGAEVDDAIEIEGVGEFAAPGSLAAILARYERRRGDLSMFVRMLKHRITIYMNKRLDRSGTLWESRFKSVLVEGDEAALMAVAAYIDLNPVRAGIVERPEEYPYCGFGEAASSGRGASIARRGLARILRDALAKRGQGQHITLREAWQRTSQQYRLFLYETGVARRADPATGGGAKPGIAAEEVEALRDSLASGAPPDISETALSPETADLAVSVGPLLRKKRVRYFTDGAILGKAPFLESVLAREQASGRTPARSSNAAKKLRGGKWGALRIFRDLQKQLFGEESE